MTAPTAASYFPTSLAPVVGFAVPPPASSLLFALGATHRTAPIALRERLALRAEAEAGLSVELAQIPGLREFVILGTCNRLELYGVATHSGVVDRAEAALCARQGIPAAEFERIRFRVEGADAVRHLLEVAAGLDSQMLGETEIFGQMKKAYAGALTRRTAGSVLNRVFQKVFQGAKAVRSQTAITIGQVSVANVAVDLASKIFGPLDSVRVLVLGAGDIGEKTARAFQSRGAVSLTVASRHREHADALAGQLNGATIAFEEREERLSEFDIVVCSTSAPTTVVSAAAAKAAIRRRPERPLLFIDLAMPRDIEEAAARIMSVFLYNLDDLARIAEENRAARAAEIAKCQAMVAERAQALWRQIDAQLASPRQALAS